MSWDDREHNNKLFVGTFNTKTIRERLGTQLRSNECKIIKVICSRIEMTVKLKYMSLQIEC